MEINTRNINVDYYYPTLEKAVEEVKETGFLIKPDDITFNLNEVRGAGLSFETEYIEIDKVLEVYSREGKYQQKVVEELKNNKHYKYIEENYIFTISRDSYDETDPESVSCEYWDGYCLTWINKEMEEVAERISKIINIIKDYVCIYIEKEVRKTDEEIPYIIENIIIKIIEKPHYARENEDGISEFEARAVDKRGHTYQVTWLAYEDYNNSVDSDKWACDWKQPYDVKLIVKAED